MRDQRLQVFILRTVAACTAMLTARHVYLRFMILSDDSTVETGLIAVLGLSNILNLAGIILNRAKVDRRNMLYRLLILWLIWVSLNSFHQFSSGTSLLLINLIEVHYVPLFFLHAYTLAYSGIVDLRQITKSALALCSLIIILYAQNLRREVIIGQVLNQSYYLLCMLPWLLLSKVYFQQSIFFAGMASVVFLIMLALKRTAVLGLVAATCLHQTLEAKVRGTKNFLNWTLGTFVLLGILIFFFARVDAQTSRDLTARLSMMRQDEGSGRLPIYEYVVYAQINSSLLGWIAGHGHNAVQLNDVSPRFAKVGFSAHNDWLEVLYDYGLPGLLLFLLINIQLARTAYQLIRARSIFAPAFAASLAIFIVMCMTSHLVLYPTYYSYLMLLWGSVIGEWQRKNKMMFGRSRFWGSREKSRINAARLTSINHFTIQNIQKISTI
jgi:hypothetical protein